MKIALVVFIILIAPTLFLTFAPWRDWIMAYRIRQARKSLNEGRETLASLQVGIADLKGKMGTDDKYACLDPLVKSLEAQERNLSAAIVRFVDRLKYVEELRMMVNGKQPQKPIDVNATIIELAQNPKLDEFLKQLNGDV